MARASRPAGGRRRTSPHAVPPRPGRGKGKKLAITLGAAAVVVVAAILVGTLTRHRGGTPAAPVATVSQASFPRNGHVEGFPSAPVTMIEYADLQCPNCANFSRTTEAALEQRYVATGKLKIEFRHFPFIGPESTRAAEAADCAGDQGKFWEYADAVFASQRGENHGTFSDQYLTALAGRLGLNTGTFGTCLTSGHHMDQVKADFEDGQQAGVTGTPTFFINGQKIVGNQPLSVFEAAIQKALASAGQGG